MLAGSATLLGAFGSSAFSAERKTYLATRDIFVGGGLYVPDAREPSRRLATIAIVDIGKRQIDRFAMDFFAHGFALKRGAWGIAATFQKIGPGAAEIDIVSGKVLRTITPEKDRLFYGHGAYSLDGRLLYSTERDEKRKTGLIAIRDAGTLAYLGEFPTYGDHPHDCHLIDDGATMVVTNGGGAMGEGSPAALTYIDVASNQLPEKFIPSNPRINTGHVAVLAARQAVVVSAPARGLPDKNLGGVSVMLGQKQLTTMTQPQSVVESMTGEALSVAVSATRKVFGVTHPAGGMVTFWSTQDARHLKTLTLPQARGIEVTLDDKYFAISYGNQANLALVSTENFMPAGEELSQTFLTGSHILNWHRRWREIA